MRAFCIIVATLLFLCAVPSGCSQAEEERTVYTLSAAFDGDSTVTATMSVDYFNDTETEINELCFNLYPNAFREGARYPPVTVQDEARAYPSGKSYGWIEVLSCTCEGQPADFSVCGDDENILVLRLKKGVFPAERVTVGVDFTVVLACCRLRLGHYNGTVNLANWYPVLCYHTRSGFYQRPYSAVGDPFCSEIADYRVDLTVPGEFSVAAGGDCVQTEVSDGVTTYSYECFSVRDVAFSLSKEFEVIVGKTGDIEVFLYHRGCLHAQNALLSAEKALSCFERLFGEYPYGSVTLAVTPFLHGGMEFPRIVYLSDALDEEELITAVVHEIAHQWWYGVVGSNQYEHAFLDEGLAEYSTLLFYENNPDYGLTREGIVSSKSAEYRAFYGVYEQLNGKVRTDMDRSLGEFCGEYDYVQTAYVRSLLMLDGFRTGVGDRRFFNGLRRFYDQCAYKVVGPESLVSAFCAAGCDAEGYFSSWIEGRAVV